MEQSFNHHCLATFAKMAAGRTANRNDVARSLYSRALAGYCRIANSQLLKWSTSNKSCA